MVAGLIHDIPTVQELLDRIMAEAEVVESTDLGVRGRHDDRTFLIARETDRAVLHRLAQVVDRPLLPRRGACPLARGIAWQTSPGCVRAWPCAPSGRNGFNVRRVGPRTSQELRTLGPVHRSSSRKWGTFTGTGAGEDAASRSYAWLCTGLACVYRALSHLAS